jgi:hypothetical protein
LALLPPETSASIDLIKNRCLAIIDLATASELELFNQFGETTDSLIALSQLKTISQEATDAFTRLSNLQLKVATSQPMISAALARTITESKDRIEMRIPAWQQSIREILSN